MELFINPDKKDWGTLMQRNVSNELGKLDAVKSIIKKVQAKGDVALKELALKFDGVSMDDIQVSQKELKNARVVKELEEAIALAKSNIDKFHKIQLIEEAVIETMKGVKCWRKSSAIEKVGLYIPGGNAPLFSTVLMLGIPAVIAGCKEVVLCTPCNEKEEVNNAILFCANLIGIEKVYKVGGAQAIAAMAYGTDTIPKVDKIFGPGNSYVTLAKELVQMDGVAIDMPAGPSEVLVIADDSANAAFVASDLLSQAEHGVDSQAMLVTDSENLANAVLKELEIQLIDLPNKEWIESSLSKSRIVVLNDLEECMQFSNVYAPEHLIINTSKNSELVEKVSNAGSVFIGQYSPESAGDYASGTNHTLPTNRAAKAWSGVSVASFQKQITFQKLSKEGMKGIGKAVEIMAEAEGLMAHKNAITLRLDQIKKEESNSNETVSTKEYSRA